MGGFNKWKKLEEAHGRDISFYANDTRSQEEIMGYSLANEDMYEPGRAAQLLRNYYNNPARQEERRRQRERYTSSRATLSSRKDEEEDEDERISWRDRLANWRERNRVNYQETAISNLNAPRYEGNDAASAYFGYINTVPIEQRDPRLETYYREQYENGLNQQKADRAQREAEQQQKSADWFAEHDAMYANITQNPDFAANIEGWDDDVQFAQTTPEAEAYRNYMLYTPENMRNDETERQLREAYEASVSQQEADVFQMSDEQKQIYQYLRNTRGKRAAEEYKDYISYTINAESVNNVRQSADYGAEDNGWDRVGRTILSSPANVLGSGFGALDVIGQNIRNKFGEYRPIDYNRGAQEMGEWAQAVREHTMDDMGNTGDFFYGVGTSMLDSWTALGVDVLTGSPQVGTALLGLSAARQGMQDAAAAGATDTQAVAIGLLNGVAEFMMENIGIDNLYSILTDSGVKGFKNILRTILGQSFAEASEEGLTTLANTMGDAVIMGDKSQINRTIAELVAQGMPEQEARYEAIRQWFGQLGMDMLAGGLSGAGLGGIGVGANVLANRNAVAEQASAPQVTPASQNQVQVAQNVQNVQSQQNAQPMQQAETTPAQPAETPQEAPTQTAEEVVEQATKPTQAVGGAENTAQKTAPVARKIRAKDSKGASVEIVDAVMGQDSNIAFKTADGRTILADDLDTKGQPKTMRIAEAAAKLNEEGASGLVTNYDGGDAVLFARQYTEVYNDAKIGTTMQQARKNAPALSDEAFRAAYTAGQVENLRDAETGEVRGGIIRNYTKMLTKAQEKAMPVIEAMFRAINRTVEIVDTLDYTDSDGKVHHSASNAQFDSKTNRYKISLDNQDAALVNVAVHETVHDIRANSAADYDMLRELVFDWLRDSGENINELRARQRAIEGGKSNDYYDEEIVANTIPKLFSERETFEQFADAFIGNDTERRNAFMRLIDGVLEIIKKALDALSGLASWQQAKSLTQQRDTIQAIRDQYFAGLDNATRQEASIPTMEDETRQSLKENEKLMVNAEQRNASSGNPVSESVMDQAREDRQEIYDIFTDPDRAELLKLTQDILGNTFFSNSAYGGSEESTAACPRSMAAMSFMDRVAQKIGRPLTVEDTLKVSQEIANWTDKPECFYCYVATDRRAYREFLGEYLKQRDAAIKNLRSGMDRAEAYEEFLGGRKPTKQMKARFDAWANAVRDGKPLIKASDLASLEALQTEIAELSAKRNRTVEQNSRLWQLCDAANYAQSASWAKKMVGYRAYNGHILKWKPARINLLNNHYGLRMYSFSDFSPAFILENMQMFTDAAVRRLKVLAYTKELDFVRIFADTDANINVSVFAYEQNGQISEDAMQGAAWAEAQKLRAEHPNVGITLVATSDEILRWGMEQDWIDVVIPYHLVRTGKDVADYFGYKNYTQESADGKGVDFVRGERTTVYPSEHNNDIVRYVRMLQEYHLTPRFERFLNGYEDFIAGKISEEAFRSMNPNYMKLVNETRRSAADTPAVQPIFNVDAARESIDDMQKRGGYYQPIGGSIEVEEDLADEVAGKLDSQTVRYSIKEGMSEEERYDELKEARLQVATFDADAAGMTQEDVDKLLSRVKNEARNHVKTLFSKFKVIKIYTHETAEIEFDFSGRGASESLSQQQNRRQSFMTFAKMLGCFDEVISNAVPIEIHSDKYNGTRRANENLERTYVFVSAYEDNGVVPVQLEVKEYRDTDNKLYVAVTMTKIKEGVLATAPNSDVSDGMSSVALPSVISIQELFANINPTDGDFLKYVPDQFLNDEQISSKREALERERVKIDSYRYSAKDTNVDVEVDVETELEQTRTKLAEVKKKNAQIQGQYTRHKNADERRKYRDRVMRSSNELYQWLAKPNEKKHVPSSMRATVLQLLRALDMEGRKVNDEPKPPVHPGENATKEQMTAYHARETIYKRRLEAYETKTRVKTTQSMLWAQRMQKLADDFVAAENSSEQEMLAYGMLLDPDLAADIAAFAKENGNVPISTMNAAQLRELAQLMGRVKKAIADTNEMHGKNRGKKVSQVVEQTAKDFRTRRSMANSPIGKLLRSRLYLRQMDAVSFFHMLGDGATTIFDGLRSGFDKFIAHVDEAIKASEAALKNVDVKRLNNIKQGIEIETADGKILLTRAQIMSLYCLDKREHGRKHLYSNGGGIVSVRDNMQTVHAVTEAQVQAAIAKLSKAERKAADALQEFMSTRCTEWGNEATMEMYGYRKFGEELYFPIKSVRTSYNESDQRQVGETAALSAIKNRGFTKSLNENATNPIVIDDILSVYSAHVADMAEYNAYLAPLADAMRWYNWRGSVQEGVAINLHQEWLRAFPDTVKAFGERKGKTAGNPVEEYFLDFIRRLNGGGSRTAETLPMVRFAKSAAVGLNLSVAIQQGASYSKAVALIDRKWLWRSGLTLRKNARLAEQYAPIAKWKSWGFFQSATGKNVESLLNGDTNLLRRWRDKQGFLAEFGDRVTWARLWGACAAEQRALDPNRGAAYYKSEEFYQKVGARLSQIIDGTQVVDSIFHRSPVTENKVLSIVTAFMSETMKSYSMLAKAEYTYRADKSKENLKHLNRTKRGLLASQLAAAVLQAFVGAWRDRDEEKGDDWAEKALIRMRLLNPAGKYTYGQKLMVRALENAAGNLNPLNLHWLTAKLSDEIFSALGGWTPSSTLDTKVIESFGKLFKELNKDEETDVQKILWYSVEFASYMTGIGVQNVYKDLIETPILKIIERKEGFTPNMDEVFYFGEEGESIDDSMAAVLAAETAEVQEKNPAYSTNKAEREARGNLRGDVTREYRETYVQAFIDGDKETMRQIEQFMEDSGLYIDDNTPEDAVERWLRDSLKTMYLEAATSEERSEIYNIMVNGKVYTRSELRSAIKNWTE